MSLQDTFYLVTIIMEILAIVLLAALVISVFYIMKKFGELSDNVNKKINAAGKIVEDPADVAMDVGAALAVSSVKKVKNLLNKK